MKQVDGKRRRGKKGEENVVRHEPGHRDDAPAGRAVENVAEPAEIGNAVGGNPEPAGARREIRGRRAVEQPLLALEQQPPDRVLFLGIGLPVLLDRIVRQPVAHRALQKVLPLQL